ncbi:MAG: glycine dehydrogenase (aminomethyl-transferring), partial [Porphyromonadaceae bacterium]|nr:glycine dehydrogenase (aminomethyl-transferring) [Porphyromonadaceae bacterium]
MDTNQFVNRHVGISEADEKEMLKVIGVDSLEELIDHTIPTNIKLPKPVELPEPMTERELEEHILELGSRNKIFTSYIGQGWYDTATPAVIKRGVLESSAWYTSYTPYQAEVSQGRLEALFNFQNVVTDLTGLELTNCSLLDEATAGAEAVMLLHSERSRAKAKAKANVVFVDKNVFETTKAVIRTRAIPQGMEIVEGDWKSVEFTEKMIGAVIQYPDATGEVEDYKAFVEKAHAAD